MSDTSPWANLTADQLHGLLAKLNSEANALEHEGHSVEDIEAEIDKVQRELESRLV